ncbi:MAG: hypothetical protein HC854_12320 [Flavobacterium sp.]|nr:hypothetical protein [Flavobacterium sp.]
MVKYKIVPTSITSSVLPDVLTDDYLTTNMSNHLKKENATFDFFIQFYVSEETTPIENAGMEWKLEVSPFIKVAEIEIPKQTFTTKERYDLAEQLSFSPANALQSHKPIGGINRARIEIYKALSKYRHLRNNQTMIEPIASEFDSIL